MNANELMLGNYFLGDNGDGQYLQITANDILELENDPLDDFYKPILITEEWLIKLGFRFSDVLNAYKHQDVFFEINKKTNGWGDVCTEFWFLGGKEIHHIHELQNLFFVLTNEKLTIKKDESNP